MVQLNTPWIFIRGLTRGNGHWGDFPEKFQNNIPNCEFELLEIPGNGTRFDDETPLYPEMAITQIRQGSKLLQKSKSVNICGVSLGGMIAMKWAELYPNEVHSLVVINASLSQFSNFYERLRPGNYFNFIKASVSPNNRKREKNILAMTSNNQRRADIFLDEFTKFSTQFPFQFKNLIKQLILAKRITLKFPILVPIKVICSENDRLVHKNCSFALSKALSINPIVHPTAGHDLPLDDPDWLIQQFK